MFISIQEFVGGLPSLSYLRNNNFNLVEIIEYCNGLLLCYSYNSVTFVKSCIICNHLTKEHVVLPSHDRLLTTYCLLIPHILTICNIRLFVFAMSKKKKTFNLYCLFSRGKWVSGRILMSNFHHIQYKMGSKVVSNNNLFWYCLEGHILICHLNQKGWHCYEHKSPRVGLGRETY